MKQLAQSDIKLYEGSGFRGFGRYGLENYTASSSGTLFSMFLSAAIGVITVVAFIWFLFILITGALGVMGAGSDKQALENSKKKITTGLIGLVVLISGLFVARLIGSFLGIENFLSIPLLINQISQ